MVGASPEHLVSYFQPMKSYKGRQPPFQCTIVEAAVATMATPGLFEPFSIGTFPYKQKYIGAGTVYGNPGERILREAREVYGYECRISIILSIGSGSRPNLSQEKAVASIGSANILSHIAFHSDITAKSLEFQLSNVDGYLRISVPAPLWSENDWANLGQIASDTEDYLARERETSTAMDLSIDTLRERRTSITIGQLSNCKFGLHVENIASYLPYRWHHDYVLLCEGSAGCITLFCSSRKGVGKDEGMLT